MSVCVIAESQNGKIKKSSFELAAYGRHVADNLQTTVEVVTFNADDVTPLEVCGATKIYNIINKRLDLFDPTILSEALKQFLDNHHFQYFLVGEDSISRYIASFLSIHFNAGYIPNVVALPKSVSPFVVKHIIFSGKAYAYSEILSYQKIIGISRNSIGKSQFTSEVDIENITSIDLSTVQKSITLENTELGNNRVSIADADIVVSGGLGMKGPGNWKMIEDLAQLLDAAVACSRPVSDMGWRPHSEHVGQTGKPVSCELYIAIGISGAIQHLAGVNGSKVKVVINNDPDAPFFKVADYGILGDAFKVVPELISRIKKLRIAN